MKTILILEDNDERIAAFQRNGAELGQGIDVKVWREATSMINDARNFFRQRQCNAGRNGFCRLRCGIRCGGRCRREDSRVETVSGV